MQLLEPEIAAEFFLEPQVEFAAVPEHGAGRTLAGRRDKGQAGQVVLGCRAPCQHGAGPEAHIGRTMARQLRADGRRQAGVYADSAQKRQAVAGLVGRWPEAIEELGGAAGSGVVDIAGKVARPAALAGSEAEGAQSWRCGLMLDDEVGAARADGQRIEERGGLSSGDIRIVEHREREDRYGRAFDPGLGEWRGQLQVEAEIVPRPLVLVIV